MIKVTVIIPVYNVEAYLPACLDSVLGQTLQDLECICIDDASPDRCGEILDDYAAKDERVRVLHLPENHMQGYGRNRGLELARGEYVYFLDSDDMITPDALEELYLLAKRDALDGIYFDSQTIVESEDLAHYAASYLDVRRGDYPDEVMAGMDLLDRFVRNREWIVFVQRQFWRRAYLLENGIFSPEQTEHEDELFSFEAITLAKRVKYVREEYFIHRYRRNSVMTRPPMPKDFHGYFRIFTRMIEFVSEHRLSGPGVQANIIHIYESAIRFLDLFEKRGEQNLVFLPEEERAYRLFRAILDCQKHLKERDTGIWSPLAQYKQLWIYGAGRIGRHLFSRLHDSGLNVAGFFVTSREGNPERIFDLPVREIDTVDSLPDGSAIIVAMASVLQDAPAAVLRHKGFPFFRYYNNVLNGPYEPQAGEEQARQ